MKMENYDKALEDCNNSIDLNSTTYFRSYLQRAEINMKLKKYDEAVYDYKKVMEIDET